MTSVRPLHGHLFLRGQIPNFTFVFKIGLTMALSMRSLSVGLDMSSNSFIIFLSACISPGNFVHGSLTRRVIAFNVLTTSPPFCTLPLTNLVFVDPHVRHRPLIMRLLFLVTTFRGADVAVVFLHRTQYDACFMFRVHAILKGLHRCRLFLFANVFELRFSGKYVRSQTVSFVLLLFQVYEQIAKRSLRDVSIRFFGKLPTARIHLPSQNGKLTGTSAETDSAITRLVSKKN